jgi:hypothetical protein
LDGSAFIDFLLRVAEKNGGRLLGVAADSAARLKKHLEVNFSDYFETTIARCSNVSTLFDRSKSVPLISIYVRTHLEFSRTKLSDQMLRTRILSLPERDSMRIFLLIGPAGRGKTFLLRWLFLSLLENEEAKIPFYIELRGINHNAGVDLPRYLFKAIIGQRAQLSFDLFNSGMEEGSFILILDGLDEVQSEKRDILSRELNALQDRCPRLTIIISSRHDENLNSWSRARRFYVLPMSKKEAVSLIRKLPYKSDVKKKFATEVDSFLYDRHQSFLSNPLLVTIMLLTYADIGNVPAKMHIFYEQAFETLFYRHDTWKEAGYQRKHYSSLPVNEFRDCLSSFCISSYQRSQYEFTTGAALDLIETAARFERLEQFDALAFLKDLQESLIEQLVIALREFEVKHRRYVQRGSIFKALSDAEKILPSNGKLRETINAYVDHDWPFTEFISDEIDIELSSQEFDAEQSSVKLTTLPNYSDATAAGNRLVESFATLPRKYTLSVKLPSQLSPMLSDDETKVELSPSLRIVRARSELRELFPIENPTFGLLAALVGGNDWEENALYVQIEAIGFIGLYGGSTPYNDALRTLRTFFGLGLALRLLENKPVTTLQQLPPFRIHLHQLKDDKWGNFTNFDLTDTLSADLRALQLNTVNGWITNPERQLSWAKTQFSAMLGAFKTGKKPETIQLAAQWFFDGNRPGQDELLAYVQTMIVIEILLGDKSVSDQTGLNELLRNRCAYLISESAAERDEILDLFSEIYRVRSQIVHRGKHLLSMEERYLLYRLRFMCQRVFAKELQLLNAIGS